jgi:hypothetical protein
MSKSVILAHVFQTFVMYMANIAIHEDGFQLHCVYGWPYITYIHGSILQFLFINEHHFMASTFFLGWRMCHPQLLKRTMIYSFFSCLVIIKLVKVVIPWHHFLFVDDLITICKPNHPHTPPQPLISSLGWEIKLVQDLSNVFQKILCCTKFLQFAHLKWNKRIVYEGQMHIKDFEKKCVFL